MSTRLLATIVCTLIIFASCVTETEPRRFEDDNGSDSSNGTTSAGGSPQATVGTGGTTSVGGAPASSGPTGGSPVTTTSSATGGNCPNDQYESNNSESAAASLGNLDDCDDGITVSAVLAGNDVDWFSYLGNDGFCFVNPSRTISSDGQARLCKFFDCGQYQTDVTCPAGTSAEQSPNGLPGCCGIGVVEPSVDCIGTLSEDVEVFLRVDKPPALPCVTYTIDLSY